MAESWAVGTWETSRGRASVWRPARLGRRVPKASGGGGGRHRTQSAGKPRTGGRRSTGSAGSSRRFPHTAEDAKGMRDGTASPAPASNRGAGCVNGARPVLRGVRAQGDQVGSPRALARKGQHRLIGAKATAPRLVSTYPVSSWLAKRPCHPRRWAASWRHRSWSWDSVWRWRRLRGTGWDPCFARLGQHSSPGCWPGAGGPDAAGAREWRHGPG